MSDAYTKLFSSITESTIWSEPAGTRLVWITFLAKCNRHGEVFGSIPGIARLANVTLAECEAALATLMAPDPYSRTPDNEGRRIAAIERGWKILNHASFDRKQSDIEAEDRARDRKREWDRENRPSGHQRAKQSETVRPESDDNPTQSGTPLAPDVALDVDQDQKRLSSALPNDEPDAFTIMSPVNPPADLTVRRAERIAVVTGEAIAAYNRILGKPNGQLKSVKANVGHRTRRKQVKRCLETAAEICMDQFGSKRITAEFWDQYFASCDAEPFTRGDGPYSGKHENWRPSFEYLTREAVMLEVFDKATSGDEAAAG